MIVQMIKYDTPIKSVTVSSLQNRLGLKESNTLTKVAYTFYTDEEDLVTHLEFDRELTWSEEDALHEYVREMLTGSPVVEEEREETKVKEGLSLVSSHEDILTKLTIEDSTYELLLKFVNGRIVLLLDGKKVWKSRNFKK